MSKPAIMFLCVRNFQVLKLFCFVFFLSWKTAAGKLGDKRIIFLDDRTFLSLFFCFLNGEWQKSSSEIQTLHCVARSSKDWNVIWMKKKREMDWKLQTTRIIFDFICFSYNLELGKWKEIRKWLPIKQYGLGGLECKKTLVC